MIRRVFLSLMTLAAILVAYEAYVLLAVPRMEPPPVARKRNVVPVDGQGTPLQSVNQYQLLLRNYFPEGHWSLVSPPIVFQMGPALLILDPQYERDTKDKGTEDESDVIDIKQFALLLFRSPHRAGLEPPRDAVVLEAPQGAHLEFKRFRPERGEVGEIKSGQFPGLITIRSDMSDPGPDDDLLVEASDLKMNTKLMYTMSPVRFRLGQNVGSGQELEIRFLPDEHAPSNKASLNIAGVDSLEIRRDVRLRFQLEAAHLLPGDDGPPLAPPKDGEGDKKPPVEVACSGPFHFDFVRYVASFDRDVELRQIQPDGPSDQLSCQQLDIHFAAKELPAGAPQTVIVDPARRQQRDLGRLEPAAIVAQGHPVVAISPGRGMEARGDRIQLGLRDQRLLVNGASDAMITFGQNVLRAPVIEYRHPADTKTTKIGRFRASGPGSLRYVPDLTKPEQLFLATWQTSIELGRSNGQPLLTLEGRPRLGMADMGGMTADRVRVFIRELQGDSAKSLGVPLAGTTSRQSKIQIVPDRLEATGHVEIDSPELTGRTEELIATFHVQPETPAAGADPSTEAGAAAVGTKGLAAQLNRSTNGQPGQAYHIDTDRLQIGVNMRGQRAEPANVTCDGHVVVREMSPSQTEQPLEIRGAQLTVDGLDTGNAHITIRGTAPGENVAAQVAQFAARGVTFLADVVELDQRENRLWSDGPGKATMLVTRDFQGNTSATPFPLEVRWQGGLNFDGRQVVFDREIAVIGADDRLRCDRLVGKLNAPIQFGKRFNQESIDLTEIECQGQVAMDHTSRDGTGVTSHERMQLARLSINQQTGAISGDGPGVIRSTHFANQMTALAGDSAAGTEPQQKSERPGLHFLRIDFQQGMAGNTTLKELSFLGRVKTVYGPVDAWDQELDPNRVDLLPPESMTLACDQLRVNEDPVAARAAASAYDVAGRRLGPVQLLAQGSVRIDGQTAAQGNFGAQCDRASFDQGKDVFLLEGTDIAPATLWQRRPAAAESPPFVARRIRFTRNTGDVTVDGFKSIEFTPQSMPTSLTTPQSAQGPAAPRR